jgi:hypothetical protein
VRARVEGLARQTADAFTYAESTNLQQVRRNSPQDIKALLRAIYEPEAANA